MGLARYPASRQISVLAAEGSNLLFTNYQSPFTDLHLYPILKRWIMLTHNLPPTSDCAVADLAMGIGAICGSVSLAADESRAGESAAAWNYCVWCGLVAGDYCGEGGGVFWEDACNAVNQDATSAGFRLCSYTDLMPIYNAKA